MHRKPDFRPDSSRIKNDDSSSSSCLWTLFVIFGGYFAIRSIFRVESGQGNILDHIICYGVLIGFLILIVLSALQENRNKEKLRKAQQEWKSKCKSVEVAIVKRNSYLGGWWEDDYGVHSSHSRYELYLELTPEQKILFPDLPYVSVKVDSDIYSKLIDRNVIRVYYQPESPMIFLLEKEIE